MVRRRRALLGMYNTGSNLGIERDHVCSRGCKRSASVVCWFGVDLKIQVEWVLKIKLRPTEYQSFFQL